MSEENCGLINVLQVLGKKHALFVLEEVLFEKYEGFNKLSKKIKISSKILAQRLKEMENAGLISKTGEKYVITPNGKTVGNIVHQLKSYNSTLDPHSITCTKIACSDCRGREIQMQMISRPR